MKLYDKMLQYVLFSIGMFLSKQSSKKHLLLLCPLTLLLKPPQMQFLFSQNRSSRFLIGIHAILTMITKNQMHSIKQHRKTLYNRWFCFTAAAAPTTFNMKNGFLITDSCQAFKAHLPAIHQKQSFVPLLHFLNNKNASLTTRRFTWVNNLNLIFL